MDDRGGGGGSFVAVRRVAPRLEQGSVYHSSSSRKNFIITLLSLSSSCGSNAFSFLSLSLSYFSNFFSFFGSHSLSLSLSWLAIDYLFEIWCGRSMFCHLRCIAPFDKSV